MKIRRLPQNDFTNGWSRILPPRAPSSFLGQHVSADWIVVGAGFVGLAAARRLAENQPNATIIVVEAGESGENASGRNSGFAIDLPHTTSSSLDELAAARSHMRLARAAIAHLDTQVENHAIECEWTRSGKYHAAVTDDGSAGMLEPFARELDALGEPYEWVEASALGDRLGTAHFRRAIFTPGCVLMNPAALTRGLADSLPSNVKLYENTPVLSVDHSDGILIETPEGSVNAPRMILGVNGFAEHFGYHRGRFVHLALAASLTRQLTPDEHQAFGVGKPWGLTPANGFGGITMRYTGDGRILIRQHIHVAMKQRVSGGYLSKMAGRHKQLFDDRFPVLRDVDMEHSWTGFICMSRNGAPAFGACAPNVWMASCHNGIGVTKGTISGLLAADMACGRDNPLLADMMALGHPQQLPPRQLTTIGARAKLAWEVWRNRHEA